MGSGSLPAASTPDARRASSRSELRPFVGTIAGLSSNGLVLTDGKGTLVAPAALARSFAFAEGRPYLSDGEVPFLQVVSQPEGLHCRVQARAMPEGVALQGVECAAASAVESPVYKATLRDCFAVMPRGSEFELGQVTNGKLIPYATVTVEPWGASFQHHRTVRDGAILLDAIVRFPEGGREVILDRLITGNPGSRVRRQVQGKSGAMPLDVGVGERREFELVFVHSRVGDEAPSHVEHSARSVELKAVGPLETPGGKFPLVCHMKETKRVDNRVVAWETWYAPGYGPVRTVFPVAGGGNRELVVTRVIRSPQE